MISEKVNLFWDREECGDEAVRKSAAHMTRLKSNLYFCNLIQLRYNTVAL
jgi:hypothetical protein